MGFETHTHTHTEDRAEITAGSKGYQLLLSARDQMESVAISKALNYHDTLGGKRSRQGGRRAEGDGNGGWVNVERGAEEGRGMGWRK